MSKKAKKVIKITKQLCTNALCVIDRGLSNGLSDDGGKVCIEYAISIAAGTPEDKDGPSCVNSSLRQLKISLNDDETLWQDDLDRAQGLRRIGIAQLGTDKMKNFWHRFTKLQRAFQAEFLEENLPQPDLKEVAKLTKARDWKELSDLYWAVADEQDAYQHVSTADEAHHFLTNFIDAADTIEGGGADEIRDAYIEGLVQVLKKLKTPGSKFLYLTEGKRKFKMDAALRRNLAIIDKAEDDGNSIETIDWAEYAEE